MQPAHALPPPLNPPTARAPARSPTYSCGGQGLSGPASSITQVRRSSYSTRRHPSGGCCSQSRISLCAGGGGRDCPVNARRRRRRRPGRVCRPRNVICRNHSVPPVPVFGAVPPRWERGCRQWPCRQSPPPRSPDGLINPGGLQALLSAGSAEQQRTTETAEFGAEFISDCSQCERSKQMSMSWAGC